MAFKSYFMPHCSPWKVFTKNIQHCSVFPGTISQRRIYFRNISSVPTIVNMVACRCCHSIVPFKDCIERKRSILIPRLCFNCLKSNVRTPLLREVITNQQKRKVYLFVFILQNLESILCRPGLLDMCEEWRTFFALDTAKLKDSFDGNIWMYFQSPQGKPFLVNEGGICLMLNIDWFQSFKHRQYSVGVIIESVDSISRDERDFH